MFKLLLKKQLAEYIASFSRGKNGKSKKLSLAAMGALLAVLAVIFLAYFFLMFTGMFAAYAEAQLDMWPLFAIGGILAILLSTLGSVFSTYSTIYAAKDGDFMMSLPIKPALILFSRVFSLYVICAAYNALVLVPAFVSYFICVGFSGASFAALLLSLVIGPLFGLSLSCLLAWVVAFIAPHVKHKSLVTTILTFAGIAVYFVVIFSMNNFLAAIVENSEAIGGAIKVWVFPIYCFALGAIGNFGWFAIYAAMVTGAFALIYVLLSATFVKFSTSQTKVKKSKYKEGKIKSAPVTWALIKKEAGRFFGSAAYLLNCGLGAIMMIIGGVVLFFLKPTVDRYVAQIPNLAPMMIAIFFIAVNYLIAFAPVSAPSVSLEGKSLPLLRSLPVSTEKVLFAKGLFHLMVVILPLTFVSVVAAALFAPDVFSGIMFVVASLAFEVFFTVFGMVFGIKFANVNYSSESMAVKRGAAMSFTLLLGMLIALVISVPLVFLSMLVPAWAWFTVITFVLIAAALLLVLWIKNKGVAIFNSL